MDERERFTTQIVAAWIAKWMNVSLEGEDEPPRLKLPASPWGSRQVGPGGPQQVPDSGGYHSSSIGCTSTA